MPKMTVLPAIALAALASPAAAQETYGPPDEVVAPAVEPIPSEAIVFAPPPAETTPAALPSPEQLAAARRAKERSNQRKMLAPLIVTELIHVADIVTTVQCGRPNNGCVEVNAPGLYGREPSLGRVLAVKVPIMVATAALTLLVARKSPFAAGLFLALSGGITGAAVVGNVRILKYF
jgi:hypothetical protein